MTRGIAINVELIRELLRHIELRIGYHWIEAIIRSLRGKSRSQFSEYKTYGNHIDNVYPEYMGINKNHWFRYGTALLGLHPSKKKLIALSSLYNYDAFETLNVGLENEFCGKGIYILSYFRTVLMRRVSA